MALAQAGAGDRAQCESGVYAIDDKQRDSLLHGDLVPADLRVASWTGGSRSTGMGYSTSSREPCASRTTSGGTGTRCTTASQIPRWEAARDRSSSSTAATDCQAITRTS